MTNTTFIIIKPDGVKRNLIGKILNYFEEAGLTIERLKITYPDRLQVTEHYELSDESTITRYGEKCKFLCDSNGLECLSLMGGDEILYLGNQIGQFLLNYLEGQKVVIAQITGEEAIDTVRKICGSTDPSMSAKGTIRGDLGDDSTFQALSNKRSLQNLIHSSDSPESAEREIKIWFE
jgi:nucleoside-diphosphate kinase